MTAARNAGANFGFIAKVQDIMTRFVIAVINVCYSLGKVIINKEKVKEVQEHSQERKKQDSSPTPPNSEPNTPGKS